MRYYGKTFLWTMLVASSNAFVIQLTKRILNFPTTTTVEDQSNDWNEMHLAHGWMDIHEEDATELWESEMAAAFDAHDDPDPGMEAAAEERAIMLAAELIHHFRLKKHNQGLSK